MTTQRTMFRPMLAGLAVVGLSFGTAACSDDDNDGDVEIDNPVDDGDVEDVENELDDVGDDIDDGVDDVGEEIDEEIDED